MVGIEGLGGVPEPKSDRPAKVRNERDARASGQANAAGGALAKDDVQFSSEAMSKAEIARLMQLTKSNEEIRTDRVEAAKQRIEAGTYKDRDVVAQVAERLSKLLS